MRKTTKKGTWQQMIGQKYGRLTIIGADGKNRDGKIMVNCRCDCGAEKAVLPYSLRTGTTLSCGCYQKKRASDANIKHGHSKSPEKKTRTYRIWQNMLNRCRNPNVSRYCDYGGRGIKVSERWQDFENFLADMGECPPGMSIDREDNDGDYELSNCHWATPTEQGRNVRKNHLLTYRGKTQPISAWAEELGVSRIVLRDRINRLGWTIEQAIETPLQRREICSE